MKGTVISCIWWNKVLFTASSNSDLKCWNLEKSKSKSLASKSNLHDDSLCGSHGIYCMDIGRGFYIFGCPRVCHKI